MAYEDFTTYTEFDEGSDITVDSATKVSWLALETRRNTGYVYKDKGVNHFNGDFTHKFEMQFSNVGDTAHVSYWLLANAIGDFEALRVAGEDFYAFRLYDSTEELYLSIYENGSVTNDGWAPPGPQASTTYYIEIVRDDDGGANNTGRLTAYIRTGSHSGALQDTLVVDCAAGEQNDFRYLYCASTRDSSGLPGGTTGFTQNLDIGEVSAGWTGKICGITNPAKINGVAVANIASVMGQ